MKHIETLLRREYFLSLVFFEYYHGGIGAMLCHGDSTNTLMNALEDSSVMEAELTNGVFGTTWYPFAVGVDLPSAINLLEERIKRVYFDKDGELNSDIRYAFSMLYSRIVGSDDKINPRFLGHGFKPNNHTSPTFIVDVETLAGEVDADNIKENISK